ncbi:hypothetical protein [Blastococcus sp. LR1]|uniref:hypothetical protein n=1 Tax=Blastococcus sp. LR1 TaxID=2877000 RepID=UPI001CCA4125|nr:hypothetical protein [Blastococcus sp. LR1]MCA0146215.1 hypothetical protein [Blastococcus sp. LR1]
MLHRRHTAALAIGLAALSGLAACGSTESPADDADTTSAAPSVEAAVDDAPGVYGAPIDPTRPDPTDVATDPRVTPAPADDATVFLTYSGWNPAVGAVEVDGHLTVVGTGDATCTLTLTRAGTSVTATVPATPDVNTTWCGGASVPGSQLSPGPWSAVLSYRSGTSTASSEPVEVVVP